MKKYISLILVLLIILSMTACKIQETNEAVDDATNEVLGNIENEEIDEAFIFNATIVEIFENSIIVSPDEHAKELNIADKISISHDNLKLDFDLFVGQIIKIEYDGVIAESYPAQINSATKIELVKDVDLTVEEKWGVEIIIENISKTGLDMTIKKNGNMKESEFTTGSYYIIEVLTTDGYIESEYAPIEGDIAWDMVAIILSEESDATFNVDWEWLYGELGVGEYRIGKEIMKFNGNDDYEVETLYKNFSIK